MVPVCCVKTLGGGEGTTVARKVYKNAAGITFCQYNVCVKTLVTGQDADLMNYHNLPSCKITILRLPRDMPLQA